MLTIKPTSNPVAVDLAHATLLMGVVASLKPDEVLELGFGAGYTTQAILQALKWNEKGHLTIVDNWCDWQGQEPPHTQQMKDARVKFVISDEELFCKSAPPNQYDILISDANHFHSEKWFEDHLRIVRRGGILFFHDTNNSQFPNLSQIVDKVKGKKLWHYYFTTNSRSDERCNRGWLMVFNRL